MAKPLSDWSDQEVRERIRSKAENVSYAYNDLIAELDRRAANRQARATLTLSVVCVVIAVVALLVSALR